MYSKHKRKQPGHCEESENSMFQIIVWRIKKSNFPCVTEATSYITAAQRRNRTKLLGCSGTETLNRQHVNIYSLQNSKTPKLIVLSDLKITSIKNKNETG